MEIHVIRIMVTSTDGDQNSKSVLTCLQMMPVPQPADVRMLMSGNKWESGDPEAGQKETVEGDGRPYLMICGD